ncbi:MAG: 3-phosphoserine/phosphohydroxythreonine transaminase [Phycisphaerales bacterium]|nr:3-phosphoserine/phosphohydroxythreonine transaminase [Phycisphaerales bacterium]
MSHRIYNFAAGPAILPEPILKQAQQDIWNIADSGIGIMEHSHRGKVFDRVYQETIQNCKKVANIPDNYHILFLQGGASSQFFMIPMSFLSKDRTADYIDTGSWSTKAIKEAKRYGKVHVAGSTKEAKFAYIPTGDEITYSANPAYVHITTNNTIYGTEYQQEPDIPAGTFLIADTCSHIFSKPIDVSKYGIIYAGAQKNLGPSGVTLVIIRDDLVEKANADLPTMLDYRTHVSKGSMFNTPPTFGIYIMGEVFKYILSLGGLNAMRKYNQEKAALIYDALDESDLWELPARADCRSLMNICFRTASDELNAKFLEESMAQGMSGLKGHRSVGGMRASVYNAFPKQGCAVLGDFIRDFARKNG